MIHTTTKVSEELNKKLHASNTMVQRLTLYTPNLNATIHSVTDLQTDGQTDDIKKTVASRSSYSEMYSDD